MKLYKYFVVAGLFVAACMPAQVPDAAAEAGDASLADVRGADTFLRDAAFMDQGSDNPDHVIADAGRVDSGLPDPLDAALVDSNSAGDALSGLDAASGLDRAVAAADL